jgi:lipoate-protein ligase A
MENSPVSYPKSQWRIIYSEPLPGALNMAVDSAILGAVECGEVPPTLRLYRWNPPCISLGYIQPISDINFPRLNSREWDVVRRPTGGRAILHTDELTYAVIGLKSDPRLKDGVLMSYQRLSVALCASLNLLGLPVQVHRRKDASAGDQPVCFENPSWFEITVNGKKIIGSAQARKKEGILQHGTLPLEGDLTRITDILNYPTSAQREQASKTLLNKATTVESVLGHSISWEEAAQAFQSGFESTLNIDFERDQLTSSEINQAEHLTTTQYSKLNWTIKSSKYIPG